MEQNNLNSQLSPGLFVNENGDPGNEVGMTSRETLFAYSFPRGLWSKSLH